MEDVDMEHEPPTPFEEDLPLAHRDESRGTSAWDPEDDHTLLAAEEAALHIEVEPSRLDDR